MAISRRAFVQLAEAILEGRAKQATKYCSDREVIKATLRGKRDRRELHTEILFTIGRPNYAEREFIKQAKRAGQKFPIKSIQLKFHRATPRR